MTVSGARRPTSPDDRDPVTWPAPSDLLSADDREHLRLLLGLSPREFGIALTVLDGLPIGAIASDLDCSPHTVDTHLRRTYRKLGVDSRAGLAGRLFVAYVRVLSERSGASAEESHL